MAKAVEIDGCGGPDAELFLKIASAQRNLSDECFPGGEIAVGLQIPAAHNVPLPRFHLFPDGREQFRVFFFHKFIEQRFIVVEDIIKFPAELLRLVKGRDRLPQAFFPVPHPHRVNMRIADQMQFFHQNTSSLVFLSAAGDNSHIKGAPDAFPRRFHGAQLTGAQHLRGGISNRGGLPRPRVHRASCVFCRQAV